MATFKSDISGLEFPVTDRVSAKTIRHGILDLIRKDHPGFSHGNFLSRNELNLYRDKYITDYFMSQLGELSELDKSVLASLKEGTIITDRTEEDDQQRTIGQRIADKMASFGGSWTFILSFSFFILLWISANAFWLANKGFDPFPFILLNLILSCLAAFQAPVIMMSQNRQEEKDRQRAKKDYMINLKAELEIRSLQEKLDHFIMDQQQEILELQKNEMDLMNQILSEVRKER